LFKNVGSSWIVTLMTIAVMYVLTPFVIRTLGVEAYGTWTLIVSLTAYLALLMLGIPMASVRYFAQHVAEGDQRKLNRAIGSCAALYLMLGLAALAVGAALLAFFVHTYRIPGDLRADAYLAFAMCVLYAAAGFVGLLPEGVLSAHEDFVRRNFVRMGGIGLRLGLTLGLLSLSPSIVVLALIQLVCLAFDFSVSWLLIRRRYPETRLRLRDLDWSIVRRIVSFSVFVLLLNAAARLSFETDALVIGAFMNVGAIPYFTVANSLILYLMEFLIAIAAVVMPMATRLQTQGRLPELGDIFLKWSKIALSLTVVAGLFLIVLGPRFIAWWIEPSFEQPAGQVLQVLMVSYVVFLPVRGVALPILMGLGKPRLPTIAFLIAGVVNLGLSILLVRPLGLTGVALGTAIPNVLSAVVVLVFACRELQMPLLRYLGYVVPRAILGALPVAAVLMWFKDSLDVRGLAGLGGAGMAMMLVCALMWVFFVYRNDPYLDLRGKFSQLLARRV
jgi:O-antigen/teichoic acid export membrane protein